jgi:acetyltransferase-like isoleucine patch superfamily enzyme
LALGNPILRKVLADKLIKQGGVLTSVISNSALICKHYGELGEGLNIMHNVMISNSVHIGAGTLINACSSIHHAVTTGNYCEISRHAALLGGCSVGNYTSIGSNATILPNVKVGHNVIVGAGRVVTKGVSDNCLVVGVPAVL